MAPGWGVGAEEEGDDVDNDEEEDGWCWKGLSFFSLSWTEIASVAEDSEELEGTCHQGFDWFPSFDWVS